MAIITNYQEIFRKRSATAAAVTGTTALLADFLATYAHEKINQLGHDPGGSQATRALYTRIIRRAASVTASHAWSAAALFGITVAIAHFAPHFLFQDRDPFEEMVPDHWREIIRFLPPAAQRALMHAYPNNRQIQTVARAEALKVKQMRGERLAAMSAVLGLAALQWKITGNTSFAKALRNAAIMGVATYVAYVQKDLPLSSDGLQHALEQSMLGSAGVHLLERLITFGIEKMDIHRNTLAIASIGRIFLVGHVQGKVVSEALLRTLRKFG